jgi:AhpC/TSA family
VLATHNGLRTELYCFAYALGNVSRDKVRYFPVYHTGKAGYAERLRLWEGSRMQRTSLALLLAGLLLAMTAAPTVAQTKKEDSSMPKVGDMAPDFTLKHFDGNDLKDMKLSDYRGKKNVVLAFYIFAFTGG